MCGVRVISAGAQSNPQACKEDVASTIERMALNANGTGCFIVGSSSVPTRQVTVLSMTNLSGVLLISTRFHASISV